VHLIGVQMVAAVKLPVFEKKNDKKNKSNRQRGLVSCLRPFRTFLKHWYEIASTTRKLLVVAIRTHKWLFRTLAVQPPLFSLSPPPSAQNEEKRRREFEKTISGLLIRSSAGHFQNEIKQSSCTCSLHRAEEKKSGTYAMTRHFPQGASFTLATVPQATKETGRTLFVFCKGLPKVRGEKTQTKKHWQTHTNKKKKPQNQIITIQKSLWMSQVWGQ